MLRLGFLPVDLLAEHSAGVQKMIIWLDRTASALGILGSLMVRLSGGVSRLASPQCVLSALKSHEAYP